MNRIVMQCQTEALTRARTIAGYVTGTHKPTKGACNSQFSKNLSNKIVLDYISKHKNGQ